MFADVQGSTQLARELGPAWADVLGELRATLREFVAAEGGREVDARGDEIFAVFAEVEPAVAAALGAQRALVGRTWPADAVVRVRMGVHHGDAASDGAGGFVGVEVHRASRICSAGHGGQILLSAPAAELSGAELRDLGLYALEGLPGAERLFQLVVPDLPSEFPPPRAARRQDVRPLRIVLADDSVLLREGIARLLEDAGHGDRRPVGQRRRPAPPGATSTGPTWRSSTSGCRRPSPTTAFVRRARSAAACPRSACSCSRSTSSSSTRSSCSRAAGPASAICSRTGSPTWTTSRPPSAGSPTSGAALDRDVVRELVRRPNRPAEVDELTDEGRELLALLAEGLSDEAIAQRLFLVRRDAEQRVAELLAGLGLHGVGDARVVAVLDYLQS